MQVYIHTYFEEGGVKCACSEFVSGGFAGRWFHNGQGRKRRDGSVSPRSRHRMVSHVVVGSRLVAPLISFS